MPQNRRYARWFVAVLFVVISSSATLTASPKQLPYNFRYDLHLSDVQCWITQECSGIVSDQPDREMVAKLDKYLSTATESIDMAIYGIRQQDWLIERLQQLKSEDIKIRATVDQIKGDLGDWETTANFPYPDVAQLFNVVGSDYLQPDRNQDGSPRTGSIMHNKFVVIDRQSVWTGSTNLSETCAGKEYNANTSLIIHSPEIARLFTREFEQMFTAGRYSIYKHRHRTTQSFKFKDGTEAQVLFAPQDKPIETAVVPFIESAKRRLSIGIFYLTSQVIADALIEAHHNGVEIKIINDATAARHHAAMIGDLRKAGLDVRVENWGGKMHMKTAVADGEHTLIGSMNWSDAGNASNDESVIVVRHNRGLAQQVERYIEDLWDSVPPTTGSGRNRDPRSESLDSINSCMDGINNDHQGGIDMQERACRR